MKVIFRAKPSSRSPKRVTTSSCVNSCVSWASLLMFVLMPAVLFAPVTSAADISGDAGGTASVEGAGKNPPTPFLDSDAFLHDDLLGTDIDAYFICEEVATSMAKIEVDKNLRRAGDRPKHMHKTDFTCVVDPSEEASGGATGIHLDLVNIPPGFKEDREAAIANDMTRLFIRGAVVKGTHLIIPDQDDSALDGSVSLSPVLEWQKPPAGKAARTKHSRRLAIGQFGTKAVVIFRISVTGETAPTYSAQEISDAVFGLDGDQVNLRTQFQACSYNKLNFLPAEGQVAQYYSPPGSESGVIEIELARDSFEDYDPIDIGTAVRKAVYDGYLYNQTLADTSSGLTIMLDDFDHIIYVLPPGTTYKGISWWIAFAYKPGVESFFNDDEIGVALNQLHEIGHNMNLHHSGDINEDPKSSAFDYGDTTCIMGYGDGKDDTRKCFNGAKMAEIGWYDRIETINPVDEIFSGKLIGVADYGFATDDHTLVVKIINPGCGADDLFISYNRKKGMNIDTGEQGDKVTVTQAQFTLESRYLGAADVNSIFEIEDFFNGRKLTVTVDGKGTDTVSGGEVVDYASVRVELEIEGCTTASDCSVGTDSCVSATCNSSNKCVYAQIENCCGNGICEIGAGETCGSCDCDCKKPTDCNDVGYFDLESKCTKLWRVGGSWDPAGHMFDITAHTDVAIYAFEIIYAPKLWNGTVLDFIHPEVYAKKGTWVGSQFTPESWEEYRGPTPFPVVLPNSTGCLPPSHDDIELDRPIYINAGETVGVYLTLQEPAQLWLRPASNYVKRKWDSVGDVFVQNQDLQLKAGVATEYKFGLYYDFMSWPAYFVGRPKYMYGNKCYLDGQCDDNNAYTTDTCISSSNECTNDVGTNVDICGNGMCEKEGGEDCNSCPEDCKIPTSCKILGLGVNEFGPDWTKGVYRYNFNQTVHGNMFDIVATEDITLQGFEIYTFRDEYQNNEEVQIWTKRGTYVEAEKNELAWVKLMNATVYKFEMERIFLKLDYSLRMFKSERRAFYITIKDGWTLNYKIGTGFGNVVLQDSSVKIYEGITLDWPVFTGQSATAQKFYGSVRYANGHDCYNDETCSDGDPSTVDSCSYVEGDTVGGKCRNKINLNFCGNSICELGNNETWITCESDCVRPDVESAQIGRWWYDESVSSYSNRDGHMFDLEAKDKAVTVYGFDIARSDENNSYDVEVYVTSRVGQSFVGVETEQEKWTLVSKKSVRMSVQGRKMVLEYPFSIEANKVRGVYITFSDGYQFVSPGGSADVGTVVVESDELKLLVGTFTKYPFGAKTDKYMFMGRVRYYPGGLPCSSVLDCDGGNPFIRHVCINYQCENIPIPGRCGNGICEEGEYCSNCPSDCGEPDSCGTLDGKIVSNSFSSNSGQYGIEFEIEAKKYITFYEISAAVGVFAGDLKATLYTKLGSWSITVIDDIDDSWTLAFSGSVEPECFVPKFICNDRAQKITMPMKTTLLVTPAGSRRTFYLYYDKGYWQPSYGSNDMAENDDMKFFVGRTVSATIGTTNTNVRWFSGAFRYDFGLAEPKPDVPTLSPTAFPTVEDPILPGDSPFLFETISTGKEKLKGCDWVAKKPENRCSVKLATHCPAACGKRIACTDSKSVFSLDAVGLYSLTCDNMDEIFDDPCSIKGLSSTCRRKCVEDVDKVPFFNNKFKPNGNANVKDCEYLRDQDQATQNAMCALPSGGGYPKASEVCVKTCNTSCATFPTVEKTSSPSFAPTKNDDDPCRIEKETDLFFWKLKDGDIKTKSCAWLQKLASQAAYDASQLGKLVSICNSLEEFQIYSPAGRVCMETCEGHKLFLKNIRQDGLEISKPCKWLANSRRDDKREEICNENPNYPGESISAGGLKAALQTCYVACKSCP